ncbi:hypothetical protein L1987_57598 [Smallanthus sonchifolius]|uniref:Uncharacterized protein n=1 Tax=Smallanthus sonchifolius TaxID=185202 RepID=A0ACB9DDF8_9ASTR|nr:hypothetical protein L1987_57598 [Smallanthus sonchifolius]
MAEIETPPKRHREDAAGDSEIETTKRHRNSYINEQQETTQDLLDFFTNLSSDPFLDFTPQPEPDPDNDPNQQLVDDDDDKESVIRHLLEASDDELGIPSRVVEGGGDGDGDGGGGGDGGDGGGGGGDEEVAGGDFSLGLCDGLWELEDEVANYYTLLQSELFMQ